MVIALALILGQGFVGCAFIYAAQSFRRTGEAVMRSNLKLFSELQRGRTL